jgi:hypothetical protein
MVQPKQPHIPERLPLSITISLAEVYQALCPTCREVLLDYISGKAGAGMIREQLRAQFEAAAHPKPIEG